MAKLPSKGCLFKATVAASLTTIAQINNINVDAPWPERLVMRCPQND